MSTTNINVQSRISCPMPLTAAEERAWLRRLIVATTPVEVAEVIVELACAFPDCERASVLWGGEIDAHPCGASVTPDEAAWSQAALVGNGFALDADGRRLAWRLVPDDRAVLLLHFARGQLATSLPIALDRHFDMASQRLQQTLKLTGVQGSHKQLERSEKLQRALFAISDLAGSDLDMPELLRGIHEIVSTLMYGENFLIVRYDEERGTMRFLYYADVEDKEGLDTTRDVPLEGRRHTLTWHLLTGGKPLMGSQEQLDEQVNGPVIKAGPESADWLGVPMLRNGQVHGALVVQSYREGTIYTLEDRALLEFVGSHILTALERKQSKNDLELRVQTRTLELAEANHGLQLEVLERQRAEQLQGALFQLAQLATADIDENEFYARTHAVVGALLNAENFFIALISDDHEMLEFPYYVDEGVRRTLVRPLGHGLSEYVLRRARPFLGRLADVEMLLQEGEVMRHNIGAPAECWLGVPLVVADEVIGLVAVQNYAEENAYDAADQELLSFAALQIANSIYRRRSTASLHQANAQLEQRVEERTHELLQQIRQREQIQLQLKHQVMHDSLTGLPNRGYLRDRLDRVLALLRREPARRCALLYLDVDRFKVINDSLGHLAGDAFLKEIAGRLMHCVREPDVVARLSGDEFAILLEGVETPAMAVMVAQRILKCLSEPLQLVGKELEPSASIGIAVADKHCRYDSADDLLRDADIALYRAKQSGRKRFEMFDEALAKNMVDVLTLEAELRHALQNDEFEPYFQPICRLGDGRVVGHEALLRWNHPARGLLGPGDFIRIAEDSGLIEAIDWRMFELSCRQLMLHGRDDTFMTLNVSARHLRYVDFDTRLLQLLQSTGLPNSRLIIEVTEGALLDDAERVHATLERLRVAGVGAALDDFGTGYSSLSYLHSLPLRMLKIDQVFVQKLDEVGHTSNTSGVMVEAILALARALNIQVVAEGIETQTQRRMLLDMGCELGQGYLLGRPGALPVPPDAFGT
ncbi:bifunctional diguanylate cyclase/phosphodiesterase [Rhodanobacter thiooxydans]|uniref:bifunctional diguanylate cyclase/phosphodiesterase n=1 Tax=Rhodanobacter thiooxydans TaxID=416169 RepID=UPI001F1E5BBC|nr:EAL domain-containing protein [Rhodanobacter thiooxydans]